MPFTTKLDFSDNRQVKQHIETLTHLSGGTIFGVPFNVLPIGPNLLTTGVTATYNNLVSTFSGNSGTTIYSWSDSRMSLGESALSAITPSNSGTSQQTGQIYTANTTSVIDGNTIVLDYTGVSFNLGVTAMTDLGGGNYSGSIFTVALNILSASSLDFTGRTIWADVSGITRTNDLIITNTPIIGYVFTCVDSEGKGSWGPVSGATSTANTFVTAFTYSNNVFTIKQNGGQPNLTALINTVTGLTVNGSISATTYLNLPTDIRVTGGTFSDVTGIATFTNNTGGTFSVTGFTTGSTGNTTSYWSASTGANAIVVDSSNSVASGIKSLAEGYFTTAEGSMSHAGGYNSVASGATSFVFGSNSIAGGTSTMVLGDDITGTTSNTTYVDYLNIKNAPSTIGGFPLGIDGNGNVIIDASDIRLKENIITITNALDKVKQLRGVTYISKNEVNGVTKLGFIAQEVKNVIPELTFINVNSKENFMGVYYDNVTALLVEAVKELYSGTTNGNVYLETQTILAEDNNIELNYSGTHETSIGGGIRVLHAITKDQATELLTDSDGNWITNTDFKAKALTIPMYSPTSSNDTNGSEGNITRDNNYLYIKTANGWKRSNLESF